MNMEGQRNLSLAPADAWTKLSDAAFLVGTLEGVQIVRAETDVAEWKMRPALAFMAGSIDNTLTIVERTPPSAMRVSVVTKGIGATATVAIQLTLSSTDSGGTQVRWSMDIEKLTGLLKLVPKGLIQATAQKVVEDVWRQVEKKL